MSASFGEVIRDWRARRRYSQLALSLEADMSARHLSFLESGRSRPSRDMVLKLAAALAMPKGAANIALRAAGFAPAFPQLTEDAPDLAPIREAIEITLAKHSPFPAVAIDRRWDIVSANDAMTALFATTGIATTNMMESIIAFENTAVLENWEETALLALARLRAEIDEAGGDPDLEAMEKRLGGRPRLAALDIGAVNLNQAVIPTHFNIAGRRLSVFSAIAQFSAVQDVRASEYRLELFFPADAATRRFFEGEDA